MNLLYPGIFSQGGFSPSDLADLFQWLDPQQESGLADNDPVPELQDFSGSGNEVVQATGANQPTMQVDVGVKSVEFDGVDNFLAATLAVPAQARLYIVARYDGAAGQTKVLFVWGSGNGNETAWVGVLSGNFVGSGSGGALDISAGASDGDIHLWELGIENGWITFILDGLPIGTNWGFTSAGNILRIGQYTSGTTFWWPGRLYQSELTVIPSNPLRQYLFTTFGITSNEPTFGSWYMICFDNAASTIGTPKGLTGNDGITWTEFAISFPYETEHFNTGIPTAGDYGTTRYQGKFVTTYTLTRDIGTVLDSVGLSTSDDGFTFYELAQIDLSAITGVTRCWAPEPFYDSASGRLYVFTSISTNDDTGPWTIWVTSTTDLATWSAPAAVCGAAVSSGRNLIDPYVLFSNGFYWLLARDVDTNECCVYRCATVDGTYDFRRDDLPGFEGFTMILVGATWRLYEDSSGMSYFEQTSGDWQSLGASNWSAGTDLAPTCPFTPRHGTPFIL